jgi:hypothetical protein
VLPAADIEIEVTQHRQPFPGARELVSQPTGVDGDAGAV